MPKPASGGGFVIAELNVLPIADMIALLTASLRSI
jgi:hypothetical protein